MSFAMKRLLFLPFFFFSFLTLNKLHADVLPIAEFGGINTDDSSLTLQNGQTPDSQNLITDDGPGIQGRKGFVRLSTQTTSDIWEFPLSNGTRYLIVRSSNTLRADTGSGSFSTTVSTIPTDRTTVATVLGDRFYFANTTDGLKYWNGTTVTVASSTFKPTMLVTHKGRLWAAGVSGAERVLFVSKYLDGTQFTTPASPTNDDATQITIAGALDENIQALYSSFQDKLIWFKKNSFGGIFGSNRGNFVQRTFSDTVGVAAPETIQDCDGYLRWLGPDRKVWEFDGATYYKISEQQDDLFDDLLQGDASSRSHTDTTQSDFAEGTLSNPSDGLSTAVTPGSVVLSTLAATSQTDTSDSDFASGTLTNLTTSSVNGSLILDYSAAAGVVYSSGAYTGNPGNTGCDSPYYASSQQFVPSSGGTAISGKIRICKQGSPGNYTLRIVNDSSDEPGTTVIANTTVNSSGISTCFTGDNNTYTFDTGSSGLVGGTAYWVQLVPAGTCDTSNRLVVDAGNVGAPFEKYYSHDTQTKTKNSLMDLEVQARPFYTSGSIVSRNFDVGFTTNTWLWNWGAFSVSTNSLTSGAGITYETQSSADGSSFDSLVSVSNGASPTSTVRRYIRYKASFTSNQSTSPVLNDATLVAGPFKKSSGTITSAVVDAGTSISAWGPFTVGESLGSGSITYQFNRSTSSDINSFSASSWTTIVSGNIPTLSVNRYAAWRASFTATSASQSPTLNDVTIAWTEGSTIRAASGYTNQRYWLAGTTASATNDLVFVYDKKRQWQKYVGISADAMGQYNSNLYFGNTNGIFQTQSGYSDNGTAITSFYRTKDYALSGFDTPSKFNYVYLTTDNSDATLSSSFRVNGSSTDYTLGDVQMNLQPGSQNFKTPFPVTEVTQGKLINLKWQVAGTSFWRLILGNLYYDKGIVPD